MRTPSGVSYVLENRDMMKKVFPSVLRECSVAPVEMYPTVLREAMSAVAPRGGGDDQRVLLTPGPYNSAYFEHGFLARRIGCELVQGSDLFVDGDRVFAKTTHGLRPVDVVYRRVDDAFLDPEIFREDSLVGVPRPRARLREGQRRARERDRERRRRRQGHLPVRARDDPLLSRRGADPAPGADLRVRARRGLPLRARAPRRAGREGGQRGGRLRHADGPDRLEEASAPSSASGSDSDPRNYIAQPRIELSGSPTWTRSGIQPRRVDLRPFVVTGTRSWVLPGGLTRVALVKGSYVVNSSQGGGSKDTWVVGSAA